MVSGKVGHQGHMSSLGAKSKRLFLLYWEWKGTGKVHFQQWNCYIQKYIYLDINGLIMPIQIFLYKSKPE